MSREEFKECYDQYFDAIRKYVYYRSGNAELATDLAQEVFLKIWEKGISYEANQTKGLLYKMAADMFVDHLRRNRVADQYLGSLSFSLKTSESPEAAVLYQELKGSYEKALAELPENQRSPFLMNRIEGLSYKEIAERLNLSVKAIEKRMGLALTSLKLKLKQYG